MRRSAPGHHVGLVPGLGEDAMDSLVGSDVLTQRANGAVAQHGGVERVATQFRVSGSMGGFAVVGHLHLLNGDGIHRLDVSR